MTMRSVEKAKQGIEPRKCKGSPGPLFALGVNGKEVNRPGIIGERSESIGSRADVRRRGHGLSGHRNADPLESRLYGAVPVMGSRA